MAAMLNSNHNKHNSLVPQYGIVPVPKEFREFLCEAYGIQPQVMAYFNQQEPNRLNLLILFSFPFPINLFKFYP